MNGASPPPQPATKEASPEADESLMLRYGAGDLAAFDVLYSRHEISVWRYVLRSVRNAATADDLLQDVWFSVVRQAAKYESRRYGTDDRPVKFKTWLFTIAHHRVVDHFRAAKHFASLDEPTGDEERSLLETLAADSGFGPFRQIESREIAAALLKAIEALPALQRDAFLLQAEGGFSVEEIAAATGTSFETAKSRLRYARQSLRHSLKEFA
jgi:RNA polymerase sigma factor (sigma-70 family)